MKNVAKISPVEGDKNHLETTREIDPKSCESKINIIKVMDRETSSVEMLDSNLEEPQNNHRLNTIYQTFKAKQRGRRSSLISETSWNKTFSKLMEKSNQNLKSKNLFGACLSLEVQIADEGLLEYVELDYKDMNPEALESMVTPSATLGANFTRRQTHYRVPFNPNHPAMQTWYRVLLLLSLAQTLFQPLLVSMLTFRTGIILPLVITIAFAFDMLFGFLTCYKARNGRMEYNARKVAKNYFWSWFFVDIINMLLALLRIFPSTMNAKEEENGLVRFSFINVLAFIPGLKLAKMVSTPHFRTSHQSKQWVLQKLLGLTIFIHWSVILFFFATQTEESTWYEIQIKERNESDFVKYSVYLQAVIQILTGKGSDFTTVRERWFASIFNIVGILGQAYILGQITLFIQKLNYKQIKWNTKVDSLNASMNQMNLNEDLKQRIRNSYAFFMAVHGNEDDNSEWLDKISSDLKAEVQLTVNEELLSKFPLFKDTSKFVVTDIVQKLKTKLYLPGDYVIRYGEIGDEMYFIIKGTVQAMNEEETTFFSILTKGHFFGEICLIQKDAKRTATVRAFTYCKLNVLSRNDYMEVMKRHPTNKSTSEILEEMAEQRQKNSKQVESILRKGKNSPRNSKF